MASSISFNPIQGFRHLQFKLDALRTSLGRETSLKVYGIVKSTKNIPLTLKLGRKYIMITHL